MIHSSKAEQVFVKHQVIGSTPIGSALYVLYAAVDKSVKSPLFHSGDCGFEPRRQYCLNEE